MSSATVRKCRACNLTNYNHNCQNISLTDEAVMRVCNEGKFSQLFEPVTADKVPEVLITHTCPLKD